MKALVTVLKVVGIISLIVILGFGLWVLVIAIEIIMKS